MTTPLVISPFDFEVLPAELSLEDKRAAAEHWLRNRKEQLLARWRQENQGAMLSPEELRRKAEDLLLAQYPTEASRHVSFTVYYFGAASPLPMATP